MMEKRKLMGYRSIAEFDPPEARKVSARNRAPFERKPAAVQRRDTAIEGPRGKIPIRIYTPKGRGPFPVVVYLHGGGWVVGSIEGVDEAASMLCKKARAVVVSVDYRLAPENKFPAAPEDCYAATVWASKNAPALGGDPARLVVGGDSAGGNLSAAVCIMARDRGAPGIALQLLVYPCVDFTRSMEKFSASGYGPTPAECSWWTGHYFAEESQRSEPAASPLFADLRGLPQAALITAQYDTFTEQCDEFAVKLRDAGVPVKKKEFRGMTHGFWAFPGYLEPGREAVEWAAARVRALRRTSPA